MVDGYINLGIIINEVLKLNKLLLFLLCKGLIIKEYIVDVGIIIIIVFWNVFIVSDFEDGFLV